MIRVVAIVVFGCLAISLGLGILALLRPDWRAWPPPRTTRWPRPMLAVIAPLLPIGLFGQIPLGVLDWNSFVLDHSVRFVPGGLLVAWGGFWGLWGYRTLGAYVSQGHESELIDVGAYRYCRNPQYIGAVAGFGGYALLCNSALTLIAWVLATIVFAHLPFVEEPWLRERLGTAYEAYCARVPRFWPLVTRARHRGHTL